MRKMISTVLMIVLTIACTVVLAAENFTPENIKEILPGKTKLEVKGLFGSPTIVSQYDGDESGKWSYHGFASGGRIPIILKGRIIYDEISEKAVTGLIILFKKGEVSKVEITY